jgi:DNA (cytosine-5)-methyltransferase 1
MKNKLKVFTAFTGVGSYEMALRNIGVDFEVVGISEVDRYALLGYDAIHNNNELVDIKSKSEMLEEFKDKNIGYNFSTYKNEIPKSEKDIKHLYEAHIRNKNYGDITKIDEKELPNFDLFTYSAPCKNISVAGKQAGIEKESGTQSALIWECERIIAHKKPKYLLMENVKNLVGKNHIGDFNKWIEVLNNIGYNSYWKVLNGIDFGVPQNRERVMMVSVLKEYDNRFDMPKGFPLNISLKDILEENVDKSLFFNYEDYSHITKNLPHQHVSYCIDANYYKGTSIDGFINKKRRQLIQLGNLGNKTHSNTRIYSEEGICPTLNSMNGGSRQPKILINNDAKDSLPIIDNVKVRRLSAIECWKLMGFYDEDFYKAKNIGKLSNTKLYERAGRGIVVPMLEEIFKNLFKNN